MNLTIKRYLFSTLLILLFSSNIFSQEGTVTINQDKEIEALLKIKKTIEISSDRYKIQIYSGLSRSSAEAARSEFLENYNFYRI